MREDSIVEEVRKFREEHAAKFGYDIRYRGRREETPAAKRAESGFVCTSRTARW